MKTAVVFYSWSGHTAKQAKLRAKSEQASLYEVKDEKRPGTLRAYTAGSFAAMRMKRTPTMPFTAPLRDYERIIIMAPVWAGHPAPAIYAALDALPKGKQVEMVMVSGSGGSNCKAKLQQIIQSKGCTLARFEEMKA